MSASAPPAETRAAPRRTTEADYRAFVPITTRWLDNDPYGHVNNVSFFAFFDTAVNAWLIEQGALDIRHSEVIGFVVENGCRYHRPISYPVTVRAGLRVTRIGNSSVRYEIGIFAGEHPEPAAEGHFVHVYVHRATNRPAPLPPPLRTAVESLFVPV